MTLAGKRLADDLSEDSSGATGPGGPRPNNLVSHDNARCRPRASATRPGPPRRPLGRQPIPRLDWLSRLSFSLVPAPLAGPPSSTWCLPGLRAFACPRGAEGSDLGVEGEDVGRVRGGICVPCSAATLWAGNEVSGEAVVARSTISCYLLTHQVHPRRACGFLVLLPPVK